MLRSLGFLLIYLSNWINSSSLSISNKSVSLVNISASHVQSVVYFEPVFLGSLSSERHFHRQALRQKRDYSDIDRMKADTRIARNRKRNFDAKMNANESRTLVKRHVWDFGFNDLSIDMIRLEDILEFKKVYVDKTRYIAEMLTNRGTFQLLIRPRRFGKTLFLNTIKDVLLGRQHLFKNTYIEDKHEWTAKYTVIRLQFRPGQTVDSLNEDFAEIAEEYGVKFAPDVNPNRKPDPEYFSIIVTEMCMLKKICNIALLVDEYDLPLLTADGDTVEYYKEFLLGMKSLLEQGYLRYVIMTGCTSINNLQVDSKYKILLTCPIVIIDISLVDEYNAVCGYTKEEIQKYYPHHIKEIATRSGHQEEEVYDEIERWYDSYMFSGSTTERTIYNPVSIMHYLRLKLFEGQSFWTEQSDHSRLVVKRLLEVALAQGRNLLDLEKEFKYSQLYENPPDLKLSKQAATSYLKKASLESLLFQAGYLTIASHDSSSRTYSLKIPNLEIREEFHKLIVEVMKSSKPCVNYGRQIVNYFNDLKLPELTKLYNNFVREKYGLRVWTTARDKENICRLMFGNVLMLSSEEITNTFTFENKTIKRNTGKDGLYLKSAQKSITIIECTYDDTDMEGCMKQAENYNLPSWETDTTLPIVRMCVNFVEGKIERIVARRYNSEGKLISDIAEYVVRKDEKDSFPYKCPWPECKKSFENRNSLTIHKGHHKRSTKLPRKIN